MVNLLAWVKQTYTEESDAIMVNNLLNYSKGFWKGLFACYDHYHIPRTNNDLERYFRQTKASHRSITGLRNWNAYINRNGEMIVLVNDALRQEHVSRVCVQFHLMLTKQERSNGTDAYLVLFSVNDSTEILKST